MSNTRKELKALVDEFRDQVKIAKQNPNKSKKKSEEWILGQMRRIKTHKVARPNIGKLYMFGYDAKYKDKSGNNTEENPRKVTIYLVSLLFCFTTYNKDHLTYKQ